jgi:hypothetical protein
MNVLAVSALAAGVILLASAAGAQAATVLTDSFDTEGTSLNYNSFDNFTVSDGTVDLVNHNTYSINCFGGAGKCVDLDGTTMDAGILTSDAFAFEAGDTVTLTFQARGNDRERPLDILLAGFVFNSVVDLTHSFGGGFGSGGGDLLGVTDFQVSDTLNFDDPYALYSVGFTALTTGTFAFQIWADGSDNFGPILDNVSLDITPSTAAIPEPTTWALMIVGFGGVGATLRQRRRLLADLSPA